MTTRHFLLTAGGILGGVVGIGGGALWALPLVTPDRILPGVFVQGVHVGWRTPAEAHTILRGHQESPLGPRLLFAEQARTAAHGMLSVGEVLRAEGTVADIGASLDVDAMVAEAHAVGRRPGLRGAGERLAALRGHTVRAQWKVNQSVLESFLRSEFPHGFREPRLSSWELTPAGTFVFQPGDAGTEIPVRDIAASVAERLARGRTDPIWVAALPRPLPVLHGGQVASAETARVLSQPLTLVGDDERSITVSPQVLATWVDTKDSTGQPHLSRSAIESYVRATVGPALSRASRDAQFDVSGERATVFAPATRGAAVLFPETAEGILRGLAAGASSVQVVTKPTMPQISATPLMEQYGIRTLLARGESDFAGSPRNRVHNIRVGAEKYHGLLVPPGAEFSFNENLGPVDGEHGFLPELVILANVTTPQYGGGLCQVSTTMFRSAIHAGLPITARRNHAYAVSYYGTPGFDATIYPPNPDLRFHNDTAGHLLIQMKLEGTKLAFELWGTTDNRQVEVLGPFPFDRQSDGSVKARLVRKVTRGSETKREEWLSNYKSPKLFPKVLAANAERESWEERVRRIAEKDRRLQEEFKKKKEELLRTQKGSTTRPTSTSRPQTPEEGE